MAPHLGSIALPESPPEHGHHPIAASDEQGLVCRHGPVIHTENHIWYGKGTASVQGWSPLGHPSP